MFCEYLILVHAVGVWRGIGLNRHRKKYA